MVKDITAGIGKGVSGYHVVGPGGRCSRQDRQKMDSEDGCSVKKGTDTAFIHGTILCTTETSLTIVAFCLLICIEQVAI